MRITMDHERAHFNVARLKKEGRTFEVVIDPDIAIKFKQQGGDVREVLHAEKVFSDAHKGQVSPEGDLQAVFGTDDTLKVAEAIIREGQIQVTHEYREKKREEKRKRIVELIRVNAIDSKSGLPHPAVRIENAIEEAKVKIDENKSAEDQLADVIKELRPILPLKIEVKEIVVHVPANYAAKLYGVIKNYGKIKNEDWLDDGSWRGVIEIPAGLQTDFFDEVNGKTHGSVDIKVK